MEVEYRAEAGRGGEADDGGLIKHLSMRETKWILKPPSNGASLPDNGDMAVKNELGD